MKPSIAIRYSFAGALCLALGLLARAAHAAEIEALSWVPEAPVPAVAIRMQGEADYRVQAREHGRWLRLSFPATTLGADARDLGALQYVKGVYPSMDPDGRTAHVDLVLERPGRVRVARSAGGYTAAVEPLDAPAGDGGAAGAPANEIREIVYAKLPGERIQVTVRMARPPSEPSRFATSRPPRVALDFDRTRVSMERKVVPVREGAVSSVAAVEGDGRSRVVLSLIKPVAYTTAIDGNDYVITVDSPVEAIGGAEPAKTTRFAAARAEGRYSLEAIDFRRGEQADGRIIVRLSDPAVGIDIREQAGEIIVDFLDTAVPLQLQRRLDVVDFATPVTTIDTFPVGRNARMIVTPKGRYEHVAYQADDVFTISVRPIAEEERERQVDEFGYSGEKLSLNFQDIEVRAALQVLADFTGLNFVVSDTVRGSLTLRLKDVPWDQALDIIVDSKNLAVRRKGNVVMVAPADEVAAKERAALEATKAVIELEPLVSELIQINYAKAEDIANLLKSIKAVTAGGGQHPVFGAAATGGGVQASTESNSLLSPRGQVTVDARTNSILIQDTPGKIREVRKLIAQLDQPVRQVLIETRLVEATDNFARHLGVRLGHLRDQTSGSSSTVTTGSHDAIIPYRNDNEIEFPSAFNVNLPAAAANAAAFTISYLRGGTLIDLELSALETSGQGKIISSPRVITANQKKASIEQGQERVFTTNVLGVGSVVTKKATLKLEVTPQITPDDRINLDVAITKDNFADATTGLLNVKQINTSVLLDNGETVVIGGIYEQDQNTTIDKVPFFGDLPLLGWLFRSKSVRDNKSELLIFLTPRIVSENLALR